jgi:hypothetical protein
MHTIIAVLTATHGTAHTIGTLACAVISGFFVYIAVRLVQRRPDYRAIHRMERENGMTGYTAPVVRQRRKRH